MRAAAAGAVAVLLLAACTASGEDDEPTPGPSPSPSVTAAAPLPAATASALPAPIATVDVERLAWGPTLAQWDEALATARSLPLAHAAGQVIVTDLYTPDVEVAVDRVRRHHLGGVILMDGAAPSADAVSALAAALDDVDDRSWPVWISADEEGGLVSRLSAAVPSLASFMAAGAATDKGAVTSAYRASAGDMRALGVNVDYAPVADVTIGTADPIIRTRSAGDRPKAVARTVTAAVEGFVAGGLVPVIKHFPGHGSVTVDSHVGLPVQDRSVERLARADLVPFAEAIDAGAPAVMMGHIVVPEWGEEAATFEPRAYGYLRDELGFTGAIITDALNMGAVTGSRDSGQAAVDALAAGADVLLMPRNAGDAAEAIVEAVRTGRVTRDRLDEAAARSILLMRWSAGLDTAVPAQGYARAFAAAGMTVATEDCDAPLLGRKVSIVSGPDDARAALATRLEDAGVEVGDAGTTIALVASGRMHATADVVVSLGAPWGIFASDAETYIATYGSSRPTIAALADVLTGAAEAGGDWPVTMSAAPFAACAVSSG
ncbi:glycoside hydrolase family 3 N-terminal domain-containing protein [Demequina gelatinilytica]|uniref:glycoside hydrolase family 3 N-terminal domain-containing protein n=1 Tax=Demequina gelatinilytica TaxID=1638980 RepID=UPI000AFFFE4F|nr:glycoside hydrolase family 3 N-terminal domain-containing protein [Demequina gelatinilytica]